MPLLETMPEQGQFQSSRNTAVSPRNGMLSEMEVPETKSYGSLFSSMQCKKRDASLADPVLNDRKIYIAEPIRLHDLCIGFPGSFTQIGRKDMLLKNEVLFFS